MKETDFRNGKCPSHNSTEEKIYALEDEWVAARVAGNLEVSKSLIHSNYRGVTPLGTEQNKAQFLKNIDQWDKPFSTFTQRDRTITVQGSTAATGGIATLRSPTNQTSFRYRRVYRKECGKWILITSVATNV